MTKQEKADALKKLQEQSKEDEDDDDLLDGSMLDEIMEKMDLEEEEDISDCE